MNYHIIFKTVGTLTLLVSVAMVVCLGLGAWLPAGAGHEATIALTGWGIAIGITLAAGGLLLMLGRLAKGTRKTEVMLRKEAVAIVGIGWIACSTLAAVPYLFCEPTLPPAKAFFEGVSGLTTTGATVFTDLEKLPKTILLWRSITQWMGGIGILAMFVLVLSTAGASGRTFFANESSLHSTDLTLANVRRTTRPLWAVYVTLTVICGLGLWTLGMTSFQAVNHAMTTAATGGFGTENESLTVFSDAIRIWVIVFMLAGAISIPLYIVLLKRRQWSALKEHEETWWFLGIFLASSLFLALVVGNLNPEESVVNIVFNVAAIISTTGYAAGDYDSWPTVGKEVILVLMMIGGCAGSTAGGLKVSRVLLWFRFVRAELTRAFRPKVVLHPNLNGHPVPDGVKGQLFVYLTIAALFFLVGSLVLRLLEPGISMLGCMSAVSSCLLNIGPAFAEFGPTNNFSGLSAASTMFLPLLMIVGRLEYIAVLVLFSRRIWRRY